MYIKCILALICTCIIIRDPSKFSNSIESLTKEVVHATDQNISLPASQRQGAAAAATPATKMDVEKKPGRAFRHKKVGKFLAESGKPMYNNKCLSAAYR